MPVAAAPSRVSNDLLLTAVSGILKNMLENGLIDRGVAANIGSDASVSAMPPDRIETGEEEKPKLNIFLYQIKPKGLDYHTRGNGVKDRWVSGAPAFELHYLISAYGEHDLQLEVLLGYAIELFQETPIVAGDLIRTIIKSMTSTEGGRVVLPALNSISKLGLAERFDHLRVSNQFLDTDEMFNLWSTLQATYRPSAVYKVSVFLSESGDHGS